MKFFTFAKNNFRLGMKKKIQYIDVEIFNDFVGFYDFKTKVRFQKMLKLFSTRSNTLK